MAVDYEEGRRLLAEYNAVGHEPQWDRLAEFMVHNAEALLNPDPWRPIEELPEEWKKDKRKVLFWQNNGAVVGVWDPVENAWRANIRQLTKCFLIETPTHFRELKGPGQ